MNPTRLRIPRLPHLLTLTLLFTASGMTVFEVAKSWLFPRLSLWESHASTIAFTTLLVALATYFVVSKLTRWTQTREIQSLGAAQILNEAVEGILTINKRGEVLSLNRAAEQFFGYRAVEVINQPVTMLLEEPPVSPRKHIIHETLPMGSILGLAAGGREVIGKRKNGESFALELIGNSITVGDEIVSVAFARDISKRKRAQRYLTAHYAATCILADAASLTEALPKILESVCEALGWEVGAYWSFDEAVGALRCDQMYQGSLVASASLPDIRQVTCLPGQGLVGRAWSTGKPAWTEDLAKVDYPCSTLAVPFALHGAFALPIMLGQEVFGSLSFFSARNQKPDRQLQDIMAELGKQMGQFIARKRAEAMLHRSEESFRQLAETLQALVQASPMAIHISDLDDRVKMWNPAAEQILGWTEADVLGQPLPALIEEDQNHHLNSATQLNGQSRKGILSRCRKKDGTLVDVSMSMAPLRDAAGTIFGVMGIIMDLTEQKRLEDCLRQAQKMEAVGQLAGGVAHDFNNLLTIITGFSELLLAQMKQGDPAREWLDQIRTAGEKAASLTRQLLAFGRKQFLQVRPCDLNSIVEDLAKMLRRIIGEDIHMVLDKAHHLGQIKADPGQLEQILLNLATNARDAMTEGGTLTIQTANTELDDALLPPDLEPGSYVMLSVCDTGCGMDAKTKARIFEPFFTTKGIGKGTGLGLATVYGIVKQSDGHIDVVSSPGQGATFRIYLPQMRGAQAIAHAEQESMNSPRGMETVLLVEDEDSVRKLLNTALEVNGYRVLEASSGKEALELCAAHEGELDLLVTDVIMPHMNGRQLAELAGAIRKNLKVLYISGYTDRVLDDQGTPGTWFLQKPVTPKSLAWKVREVLDAPPTQPDEILELVL